VLPTGALTQEQPQSTRNHPEANTERTTSTASTQRLKTLELNTNRKIEHDFRSPDLLQAIDEQSARSWPKTFAPTVTACKLCGHKLGEEVTHPRSEGQQSWTKSVKNFALSYLQETQPVNLASWSPLPPSPTLPGQCCLIRSKNVPATLQLQHNCLILYSVLFLFND